MGLFDEAEWAVYCEQHAWMLEQFPELKPAGVVYLRCSPETCLKRLQYRARSEETQVPLSYLQGLHDLHEEWLLPAPGTSDSSSGGYRAVATDGTPVLVLDGDTDFKDENHLQADMARWIDEFACELPCMPVTAL